MLKTNKKLIKEMGIEPHSQGRGAITGKKRTLVWDYLTISEAKDVEDFTKYPHITIGIHNTETDVAVTIPHGVKKEIFNNIFKRDISSFNKVLLETLQNMMSVLSKEPEAKPFMRISQSHFPSRSGGSIRTPGWNLI